jgi:hypothetical protein
MNLTVVRDDVYVNYENGNLHLYYSIEQTSISMHILGIRTHEFDLKKRLVKKFPASHLTWTGLVKKQVCTAASNLPQGPFRIFA